MRRGGVRAVVTLTALVLAAGSACGSDGPTKSTEKKRAVTTTALEPFDSTAEGGYSADEPGVSAEGTTTLYVSITTETEVDEVERAMRVIGTRLRAFGAAPMAMERDGKQLVVSWDRGNVADEVAAVVTSRGHFQFRPVLEVTPGACKIETPADQAAPEVEIRLSALEQPAHCHRLGPSELSDPQVDEAIPRRPKLWQVDVKLGSTAAHQFEEMAAHHVGEKLAIVVDGILQSASKVNAGEHGGVVVISGGFTEAAARHCAALLDGGVHTVSLRADKLERRA